MRTTFLLVISFVFLQLAEANDQKKVKPAIKEVTVFLNRAQLSSTATASIGAGTTDIVLEGLPPSIDPQSIQISGKGEFIIMSVKHALNYLDPQEKTVAMKALEDTIEKVQMQLDLLSSMKDIYTKEEQLLIANQAFKGEQHGLTPDMLEDMADFFRDRLTDIHTEIIETSRDIQKTSEKLQKLKNQLNALNKLRNQPSAQIVVTVSNKAPKTVTLDINYIVANAGWYPLYDFRAKDSKSPVQLSYKAQVYQNTGVEWNNVKLTLSTSNPSLGGTRPELSSWYLNIYEPRNVTGYDYDKQKRIAPAASPKAKVYREDAKEAESIASYTQVVETALSAEFEIAIPYTIPSDGVGQLVDVQNHELPATYTHSAVPKIDKAAFLMAMVTGWDNLNLLSGNANIYFEGTYVGQSFLDMQNTKDTLQLSLGRDSKVVIERKKLVDFTSKKMIGSNRKEDYAYEITVRNTKKDPIEIIVEDQIPVSQNSQIEVEAIDLAGAEHDAVTGKLVWKLKLGPAESKTIVFKYSVKYPKNKSVSGLY